MSSDWSDRQIGLVRDSAGAELALWAASHNILKAITARDSRLSRQASTTATAAPLPAAA